MKAPLSWMTITLAWVKKKYIKSEPSFQSFITIFLLLFELSLSCKLLLIDLISFGVCFFPRTVNKFVCMKRKETNEMDRKFLVTMHTNCHFQLISVVKIKKNVAVDRKSSFFFCTQFGSQNAGNGISELPDFNIFWGSMPPDPPRLRAPWLYSRLFFPNQLPTSNFIETPDIFLRNFDGKFCKNS